MALPDGPGIHPGVVLAFHRGGMDAFTTESADRLAAAGFAAAAPDFYHRREGESADEAINHRNDAEVIADLTATVNHLRAMSEVDDGRLVSMGHCMGGRIAWLAACALPDAFKLCVPFYSGGVFTSWGDGPTAFDRFDQLKCPVVGFFGNEDGNPSPEDVGKFDARLDELGIEHVFNRYDGAGHAFQNTLNPKSYRPEISERAWETLIGELNKRLM
jgi:carboxymethylenebutenolidase